MNSDTFTIGHKPVLDTQTTDEKIIYSRTTSIFWIIVWCLIIGSCQYHRGFLDGVESTKQIIK